MKPFVCPSIRLSSQLAQNKSGDYDSLPMFLLPNVPIHPGWRWLIVKSRMGTVLSKSYTVSSKISSIVPTLHPWRDFPTLIAWEDVCPSFIYLWQYKIDHLLSMHASPERHFISNCIRSLLSNSYKRDVVHLSMHDYLERWANSNWSNCSNCFIQERCCPSIYACLPGEMRQLQLRKKLIAQLIYKRDIVHSSMHALPERHFNSNCIRSLL